MDAQHSKILRYLSGHPPPPPEEQDSFSLCLDETILVIHIAYLTMDVILVCLIAYFGNSMSTIDLCCLYTIIGSDE